MSKTFQAPRRLELEMEAQTSSAGMNPKLQNMVYSMLNSIGEDPQREGLQRTPQRFAKAWKEMTSGYQMDPVGVVGEGLFASEGSGLVSVRNIDFFSLCEHHLLPFWGQVSIAYWPGDKILGLSKLARLVEVFSKRLQVQERLTQEIAESISSLAQAKAVHVTVRAQHMCMMMRGVQKTGSLTHTETSLGLDKITDAQKERLYLACGE